MGKRGEGWFVVQLVLFAIILLAPPVPPVTFPLWLRILGLGLAVVGGVLGTGGVLALDSNLTVFPKPIEDGTLVTTGVYGVVRHPIYTGLILGTLGLGLFRSSLLGSGLALVLFIFFDLKSRREEKWLIEAYPGYVNYRKRVKKLMPWIY
jgi:protein-S-isoprenylcysteine O-methyltransferase Ste14